MTIAQVRERELLLACGSNPYQRALVLTQMAPLQPDSIKQAAVLEVGSCALHQRHLLAAQPW